MDRSAWHGPPNINRAARSRDEQIVLENDALRIAIDSRDGRFTQIRQKTAGLELIQHPADHPAWRIERTGQPGWLDPTGSFSAGTGRDKDGKQTALLHWRQPGLTVVSRVKLGSGDAAAEITVHITTGNETIDKIEYPILGGIGDLAGDADSCLAHPQGTGFLFRRPRDLFESEPLRREGLRYSPYPEGFSGSSMQFMSYYAEGVGGFYLAAHDGDGAMKWLNFFKDAGGELVASFMHQAPDVFPGNGYDVPYPLVIAALPEGSWYAAADHYKRWAVQQSWAAQGMLAGRNDRCPWLLDEVGFATFGVNAARDRSAWLKRFHETTDTPVFHVLGVNWPRRETGYGRGHPGGRADWFPARFDASNLATIEANGDYWAPFEFDLLLDADSDDGETITRERLRLPDEKYSFDAYRFPFMCPASESGYLPALHRWRDETLVRDYGADALYYDISANNVLMACRDPDHGHPVGGGGWMVDAYSRMWAATKRAASVAKGAQVPQGAEMVSELFIPALDFYQARAEASPLSAFEADFFRDWIRSGDVEKIPLFTYVYHEFGPVRLDGWGKLAAEAGELFYWVAARVALWGGLFELNYEFSPLETLDGWDEDVAEHYADIAPQSFAVDPAKAAFVREIATARSGFARAYLVYGTMLRPLDLDRYQASLTLDYRLYNVARQHRNFDERGTMRVEAIAHAAWRAPDGKRGFLFVNLDREPRYLQGLTIPLDRDDGSPHERYTARVVTSDGSAPLPVGADAVTFDLTLEPRKVALVELRPVTDAASAKEGGKV